jgi:hypothetical protein
LGFNFVGGSGLKESVDKLQNALTFNYYANTEIYDDRADVTDTSYTVLDKDFLQFAALNNVRPPGVNNATPNNGLSNETTIGTIISTELLQTGQTGTIAYQEFMDKLAVETQTYFTNVVNKNRETVNQYNNALRQQWMLERNYSNGKFLVTKNLDTILFGKPYNTEKRIDVIFEELITDIKDENDGFIQFMKGTTTNQKDFSPKVIRQLKENYISFVKNKKGSYQNAVTTITQSMVNIQQSYLQYVSRANTIPYYKPGNAGKGTDGSQQKNGNVTSFVLTPTPDVDVSTQTATNTLDELKLDIEKINSGITEFNKVINANQTFTYKSVSYSGILVFDNYYKFPDNEKIFVPFSKSPLFSNVESTPFRRTYMIVSDDVVDDKKYETFKNAMIGNIINNHGSYW